MSEFHIGDRVILGLEDLPASWPAEGRPRLGAVLHGASVMPDLRHTLEVLESHDGELFELAALFGPQHGFDGTTQDNMIEWEGYRHPRLGIPVHSLYGQHREPSPEMLAPLDVLLVDLQDVGARYYTFIWTLFLCLKAAEKAGVDVVVVDRPNPINGVTTEGEPQDPGFLSFVGLHPLPVRHGKSIGELAVAFQRACFPGCRLDVIPMQNWNRNHWFDETGLPWVMPSPNMPTLDTATVYPGMCLLEGTNLSEGRGTTRPFELFGAPWIPDAAAFSRELNRLDLPGCHFRAAAFEPTFQKHAGTVCRGAQIHVTDREVFQPLQSAVAVLDHCGKAFPGDFAWNPPPYEYEFTKLPIEILLGKPVDTVFPRGV